jgi:Lar family restriction alleviation protein
MSKEIKSCPFCGSYASLYNIDELYDSHADGLVEFRVICGICEATNGGDDGYKTEEEAVSAWNRRSS